MKITHNVTVTREEIDIIKNAHINFVRLITENFPDSKKEHDKYIKEWIEVFAEEKVINVEMGSKLAGILYKLRFKDELTFQVTIDLSPKYLDLLFSAQHEMFKMVMPVVASIYNIAGGFKDYKLAALITELNEGMEFETVEVSNVE